MYTHWLNRTVYLPVVLNKNPEIWEFLEVWQLCTCVHFKTEHYSNKNDKKNIYNLFFLVQAAFCLHDLKKITRLDNIINMILLLKP